MKLLIRTLARDLQRTLHNVRDCRHREARIHRLLKAAPPLLVYQVGKVGSSSLEYSLDRSWPGFTVHAHTMAPYEGETLELTGMREFVVKKRKPIFIISVVREPIARNVSAFFENFDREINKVGDRPILTVDKMIEIFLTHYPHDHTLTWFDKHMKADFGIDVYQHPFPSTGVQVIEQGHVRLLLMRVEVDDAVKESAVKDFLGLKEFQIKRVNDAGQKSYSETYRVFREKFIPPDSYLEKMYESRFFKHFYPGQMEQFVAKWKRLQTPKTLAA
ncbi:MAG: hypothetical protein JWO95_3073 [Verrucomicrobiales bacterium]|nr:hypothetical protein [Verrucomicrobiales bacterium]